MVVWKIFVKSASDKMACLAESPVLSARSAILKVTLFHLCCVRARFIIAALLPHPEIKYVLRMRFVMILAAAIAVPLGHPFE